MKKFILFCTVAAIAIMVYWGCRKESIENKGQDNNSIRVEKSNNNGNDSLQTNLCVCGGNTLKQTNGEWGCPSGTGCSKVTKCPCPDAAIANPGSGHNFVFPAFKDFEQAFNENKIAAFFMTERWRQVFPGLIHKPDIVDKLKGGDLKFVKKENLNTNQKFYIVVNNNIDANSISEMDAVFAVEVPMNIN